MHVIQNDPEISQEIFQNYSEDIDFMDTPSMQQQSKPLNSSSSSFEEKEENKAQEPSYQIKAMMQLIQAFKRDRQKLHENMAHCLFCIYNQQDISHYFLEMMQITEIMKYHNDNAKFAFVIKDKNQLSQGVTKQLQLKFQEQTSPKFVMEIVQEIIGDIMKNIRQQILQKMKELDVIVKEPVCRRASFDDYNLCYETNNKKFSNGQNLIHSLYQNYG